MEEEEATFNGQITDENAPVPGLLMSNKRNRTHMDRVEYLNKLLHLRDDHFEGVDILLRLVCEYLGEKSFTVNTQPPDWRPHTRQHADDWYVISIYTQIMVCTLLTN
jgi:hypothetical protein